jgi:hypothetical protein
LSPSTPPRVWPFALTILGVVLIALGVFIFLAWLLFDCLTDGLGPVICYYPGIHPLLAPPLMIVGAVLLILGVFFDRGSTRRDFHAVGTSLLFLVIGSGVLVVGLSFGYASIGLMALLYMVVLLTATVLLFGQGAWSWWNQRARIK